MTKQATGILAATVLAAIVTASGAAWSAPGEAVWMRHTSGDFLPAADAQGGAAVGAYFWETTDFGGGPVTPVTWGDLAVMRYDAAGALSWLVQISPLYDGFAGFLAIATDATGAVYLAGTVSFGAVDFGGGELAATDEKTFLVKYDAAGNHAWSRLVGDLQPRILDVTGGRLCVIGTSTGTVDLGGGPLQAAGQGDAFAGVLDLDGNHVWSAGWGDAGQQWGLGGGLDAAGNLTLAVGVEGSVDFGGGQLAAAATDLGLASFDAAGQHRWSTLYTGTFAPWPGYITAECRVAADGRSVLTGWYDGPVDLGGGPLNGASDVYVAVHDTDGALVWNRSLANANAIDTYGASIADDGRVAVSGVFGGAVDLGGGEVSGPGQGDLFLAVYGEGGAHLGSWAYGSPEYDDTMLVDQSPSGDLIVWGYAGAGADFGLGPTADWGVYFGRITGPDGSGGGTSGVGGVPLAVTAVSGHPNPFNPTTTVSYTVDRATDVTVGVYDLRGRLVQQLVPSRPHEPGAYSVRFRAGASGVYLVRVRAGDEEQVVKLTAVK